MFSGCTVLFYNLFLHLEEGLLDPCNEIHLYCLHYIFVPRLNESLSEFSQSWNHHPLSSTQNLTPRQLWMTGNHQDDVVEVG